MEQSVFTPDQLAEIEQGKKEQLDVSIYAKPEFLAIQMHEIRIGLEEKLQVSLYADSRYDWFQMEEIRKGLEQKVDVSKYASVDRPFDVMRQIRKGLEAGIDLSGIVRASAETLRQIRKAKLEGIDLTEYIEAGYEEDQLHEIRLAKKHGVDIDAYVIPDFRGISIREIRLGLEQKIEVSEYARREYNWQQMREIRLGLEKRLDVSNYSNVLYSWKQMREIRFGLEEGLDVGNYKSFMYTSTMMRQRRLALIEQTKLPFMAGEVVRKKFPDFDLVVNPDGMEAAMVLVEPGKALDQKQVLAAIRDTGIVKGVNYAVVKAICDGTTKGDVVVVAKGVHPKDGADGYYEFFFDTDMKTNPKLLEDGSVDYQNIKMFEIVKKGQKIAYYHEAQEGVTGYKITGETLPARKGKEKKLLSGTGFALLADKKTYVATEEGKIEYRDNHLTVTSILVLGDVTRLNGSVEFNGSVYVRGNVGQGASIRATRDVLVDGYMEAAVIEAGGDIILKKGCNADGKGFLRAGGDVMGLFFESSRVWAGGMIRANYCMRSELHAGTRIEISGGHGVLVGGSAQADNQIEATDIGNGTGVRTKLVVGNKEKNVAVQREFYAKETKAQQELQMLMHAYQDFRKKFEPEVRNVHPLYLKIEDAIYTKRMELDKLKKQKDAFEREQKKVNSAKVIVNGTIYAGVSVEINGVSWKADNMQNITLIQREKRIVATLNV